MTRREYGDEERERRRLAYNARKRAWRAANVEKSKAICKRWYDSHKDDPEFQRSNRDRAATWQRENRDRVNQSQRQASAKPERKAKKRAQVKAWNERNSERRSQLTFKHHALRRGANAPDADALFYMEILRGDPCSYCGVSMQEVDHIAPMAGGGTNDWDNLTSACLPCNREKFSKPLLHYLRTRS